MITDNLADIFATIDKGKTVGITRITWRESVLHNYMVSSVKTHADRIIILVDKTNPDELHELPVESDYPEDVDICHFSGYRFFSESMQSAPYSEWDSGVDFSLVAAKDTLEEIDKELYPSVIRFIRQSLSCFPYRYKMALAIEPFIDDYNVFYFSYPATMYQVAVEWNQHKIFSISHLMGNRYRTIFKKCPIKYVEPDLFPRSLAGETIQMYLDRVIPLIGNSEYQKYGVYPTMTFDSRNSARFELFACQMPLDIILQKADPSILVDENTLIMAWIGAGTIEEKEGIMGWAWRPAIACGELV